MIKLQIDKGVEASGAAIATNIMLAVIKIITGIVGNSFALIADGIESTTDVVSSVLVRSSLIFSTKPPDEKHPFGHGKAESLTGLFIALLLLSAAIIIIIQSIQEIAIPHSSPAWYTLPVLVVIIIIKESLYRYILKVGNNLDSTSLKSDAWHHRSDSLTSIAALIGISIALIGGAGYEVADDWAALFACVIIIYNAIRLIRPAFDEVMDASVPKNIEKSIKDIAKNVEGVKDIEQCRIRKSGLGLLMDIHVVVNGAIPVSRGHKIGHDVKDSLLNSDLKIVDVVVHVEPDTF